MAGESGEMGTSVCVPHSDRVVHGNREHLQAIRAELSVSGLHTASSQRRPERLAGADFEEPGVAIGILGQDFLRVQAKLLLPLQTAGEN